ncbi:large ribosomal subunit protein P2-like isoform X1 [Tubulanus polymorphus]|uniref:large ribosomal subunit protein P2-like isoform X1 n=1 Tax=Tubulanus polymorphus TaxID=672921 RepID=UPI003DA48D9C
MRYVAAYLLAVLGGNKSPSKKDIEKILESVGIDCEAENVNKVISELSGKDIEELMEAGRAKLASVPSGGSAVAASSAGAAADSSAPAAAEEEKKKEESEEESDDDMGFGLFD